MLSYQHIYHAGNLADVHKHMALSVILTRLMSANKPLTYIETHAGRGIYDLNSAESIKTNEAEIGVKAMFPKIDENHPYAKIIKQIRAEYGDDFYAGSPYIARTILSKSQLHLCELHPQEFKALELNIGGANLHNKNGYDVALKISPPKEKRGLVLVDPSYEVKTEYEQAANFVLDLQSKWPQAVILLWYPILEAGYHQTIAQMLEGGWNQEVLFKNTARIKGSGIICSNLRAETIKELEAIPSYF